MHVSAIYLCNTIACVDHGDGVHADDGSVDTKAVFAFLSTLSAGVSDTELTKAGTRVGLDPGTSALHACRVAGSQPRGPWIVS